ncbi:hypothetical protein GW781_13435 [bacterium]|nr:hypothetical protein [bacterium]NCT22140.1 hypothetical protein [bacterium]
MESKWQENGLVLIHHIRKPVNGGARMLSADFGMEDLSGSGYITQAARVVLGLRIIQSGPEFDPNGPREFKMLKNNLGTVPAPLGFSFAPLHPKGVMLKWQKQAPRPYREPTQREECKEWLEDFLKVSPAGVAGSGLTNHRRPTWTPPNRSLTVSGVSLSHAGFSAGCQKL